MRKLLVPIAALCLAATPVLADSLEGILDKHFDAQGGLARLRAVKSVAYTGTNDYDGKTSKTSALRARPNLLKNEYVSAEGVKVKAFDGKKGWMAKDGKAELIATPLLAALAEHAEFDDALVDHAKRGIKVKLLGKEGNAYVLEVTMRSGDVQKRYLDDRSFLETKRVATYVDEGKTHTKTIVFSDFRKTAGIVTAHVRETESSGKRGRFVVDELRWDAKVETAAFAAPSYAGVASTAK
jgi:outer membrane lipoprotein-sorting protein